MSNFTYLKKDLLSWIDNAGQFLGIPRITNESLFDYKQRLLNTVRYKPSSTIEGFNNVVSRDIGEEKVHVLTIESTLTKPIVNLTSKYLYLYDDSSQLLKLDIYNTTIGTLYINLSQLDDFTVSYYDDSYESVYLKKVLYGNNLKTVKESCFDTKCFILQHSNIKNIYFTSSNLKYEKSSLAEVLDIYDYYIDYTEGIVFCGQNISGFAIYNYYENPYKLFYSPIVFYPLNDEDIDYLIKEEGNDSTYEFKRINLIGNKFLNELIKVSPTTIGK